MNPILKWSGIVLGGLVTLLLVALAVVFIASEILLDRTYPTPREGSFRAATTPSEISRGAHLALVYGCADCHGKDLSGALLFHVMGATVYASNLRQFANSHSDDDFDRTLRHGLRPDGTSVVVMPSEIFQFMDAKESADILGYLRLLKSKGAQTPAAQLGIIVRAVLMLGKFKTAVGSFADVHPALDLGSRYAQGRHLAMVACGGCHSPSLSGESSGPGPVTPDLLIVASYERGDFIKLMRTGKAAGNRELPLMSATARKNFKYFSDDELASIYDYLVARGQKLTAAPKN